MLNILLCFWMLMDAILKTPALGISFNRNLFGRQYDRVGRTVCGIPGPGSSSSFVTF